MKTNAEGKMMKAEFTGFDETTGECLGSCGGYADDGHTAECEIGKAVAELGRVRHVVMERERQLSIALAYIGRSKNMNVVSVYNESDEFVDIFQPVTSTSQSDGVQPVKLAALQETEPQG